VLRPAGKPAFFGWATNYLIEVKNAVIMDVAATPAIRSAEVASTYRRNFERERSGVTKANTRIYRASKVDRRVHSRGTGRWLGFLAGRCRAGRVKRDKFATARFEFVAKGGN